MQPLEHVDMVGKQSDLMSYVYSFALSPKYWATYVDTHNWRSYRLVDSEKRNIPAKSGIYTLVVMPSIANHPNCAYLMYVGQTDSLRRRFGEYLTSERRESGRPKIFRCLTLYNNNIWFYYTEVDKALLDDVEHKLRSAYIPPCNDEFGAELNPVVKAAFP